MARKYFDNALSWLQFVRRVLAQAENENTPLLERVNYVAIVSELLDEFFQVRIAELEERQEAGMRGLPVKAGGARRRLAEVRAGVEEIYARQSAIFRTVIQPGLAEIGAPVRLWDSLDDQDRKILCDVFHEQLFPVLTPLAVDPAHPFPFISNLSLNLAVMVREPDSRTERFARVKVPPVLPRFVELPDGDGHVPLEQVITAHLDELFPGLEITRCHPFRVTRYNDIDVPDMQVDDLMEAIRSELGRSRFGRVARLEVERNIDPDALRLLVRELEIEDRHVYRVSGLIGLGDLSGQAGMDFPRHRWPPYQPVTPPRVAAGDDLFEVISRGDLLVHHPYESFGATTGEFLRQAARDPQVLAIKQTLYRASPDSSVVNALIEAAERGKQVAALVELKARFEEARNIERAEALEEAGAHVAYGLVGLKTHAKLCLVVRREGSDLVRYVHTSTGNYNERTARLYEDIGFFTRDPEIGADVSGLFNHLTGYGARRSYGKLLVAPAHLREQLLEMVERESSYEDGHVVAKMNSLVDQPMIDALYRASQAGTRIELIVRGICRLRPGVPGMSENITVRSIVGRFLEHSRIVRFGRPERGFTYYIGSADWMPRNLDRRVESLTPIEDPALQERLEEILDLCRADDHLSWLLQPDGSYLRRGGTGQVDLHQSLMERALRRSPLSAAGGKTG